MPHASFSSLRRAGLSDSDWKREMLLRLEEPSASLRTAASGIYPQVEVSKRGAQSAFSSTAVKS